MKTNRRLNNVQLSLPQLTPQLKRSIALHRQEIADIISGKDTRALVVVGPCSAWPPQATIAYAKRLKKLADALNGALKIVMRVYTQKPRTSVGWKGLLHQSDPCGKPSVVRGVQAAQRLMHKIATLGLAVADEALFLPETQYLEPYLSYVAIGARSSEDQMHRSYAATRDFAVGMKNPTSGDVEIFANSIRAAQAPALFYAEGKQAISEGNPLAHGILRGGKKPNYRKTAYLQAAEAVKHSGISPVFLVDTNHANSQKDPRKQPEIVRYLLRLRKKEPVVAASLRGFMIESFIHTGNQPIDCSGAMRLDGLSITDPTLGWEETEALLQDIATHWC